jgi:hypothetical protein
MTKERFENKIFFQQKSLESTFSTKKQVNPSLQISGKSDTGEIKFLTSSIPGNGVETVLKKLKKNQ